MQQLDPKLELSRPPRPLIESNPVAEPYPVQALGGILGPAVERIAEVIGVPQALAAQSVLAASALATQGHAGLQLDPLLQGQGILGRCLMTWPTSLAGQRSYQAVDLSKDAALKRYHHRLSALFYQPWSLSADGALQLSKLSLSPLARRRWIDLHDAIEAQLGEFGELASVRPSGSKAADNLLRVAGILAVVEESSVVEVDHIQRASALVGYYLNEIQRLTEQEPVCRVKEEADRLLRWLQVKDWKRFSIRELNRNGPRFARKSSRHAAKLLVELIDHQWLITDGHTFEVRHV
ncbi:hypothetical protein CXB38_05010 [Pseudomonas syringae]|uniref:DUF3987 domain-containing protein n=1 Tax=Pseudomonas syringae TaxID=317 RepID=UPI000CDAE7D1|nr:DUF3987 domain-containing protein [Pseudomonas syringae]POP83212.1 hypothetical protein CXB38_05010 [Pseudomonas syringae]